VSGEAGGASARGWAQVERRRDPRSRPPKSTDDRPKATRGDATHSEWASAAERECERQQSEAGRSGAAALGPSRSELMLIAVSRTTAGLCSRSSLLAPHSRLTRSLAHSLCVAGRVVCGWPRRRRRGRARRGQPLAAWAATVPQRRIWRRRRQARRSTSTSALLCLDRSSSYPSPHSHHPPLLAAAAPGCRCERIAASSDSVLRPRFTRRLRPDADSRPDSSPSLAMARTKQTARKSVRLDTLLDHR